MGDLLVVLLLFFLCENLHDVLSEWFRWESGMRLTGDEELESVLMYDDDDE